jgi:membrane protein implicated in regulation of membrane protease activity
MSPPARKGADAVNLELSAFWVGLTHFVQQTGALGLLAVALIWGIPKILEERKDRQSIEEKMENYMKQDEGHMQRIEGFMGQVAEAVQRIGDGQRRGHDL